MLFWRLTPDDVADLERILWSEVGTRQDYEAEYGGKPLGEFVREIVGMDMNAAKEAFAWYLNDASLDSCQIYFVNQIVEYIVHNGVLKDLSVLQEPPFTDRGSVAAVYTRSVHTAISTSFASLWIKGRGIPKSRGRKPAKALAEYKRENERLRMENELLRDFLRSTGRK